MTNEQSDNPAEFRFAGRGGMNRRNLLAVVGLALVLAACAAGPNAAVDVVPDGGSVAGLWQGWWHGIITPVTFVISLFTENVSIYEVHNSGGWYDFGFVVGLSMFTGGGAASSSRKRRR